MTTRRIYVVMAGMGNTVVWFGITVVEWLRLVIIGADYHTNL